MREKYTKEQAMIEAYDSLIDTAEDLLDDAIGEYNSQMVNEASKDIKKEIKSNGYDLGISIANEKGLNVLESNIYQCQKQLYELKESRKRYENE